MALPPTRSRSRVLTASAAKLGQPNSATALRLQMGWQTRALEYIDLVPELNYASRFYARMLKQLGLYPAKIDDLGKSEPTQDDLPVKTLARIQDPAGGRSALLGNYGRLMFATGEGILFGRDLDTLDEAWTFVWNDEITIETLSNGDIKLIIWKPTTQSSDWKEYGPDEATAYRMWTTHPRRSGEADSPMRAALEIAEELVILTQAVRATAVSRTVQGILAIPIELMPPPAEGGSDEDPMQDPLFQDFTQHMVAQKEGAGTAEAVAPFFFAGAHEFLDGLRHIKLHDPANDYAERDLRKEAVERLARGFDMPPEVLLGLSDANHWAARQILDDMWRSHGAPIAEQFCDDLNSAYLRPALRQMGYEDWHRIVIGYDESQIVVKADRSADAIKAHQEMTISDAALRKELNFDETAGDIPKDELDRRLAVKMRDPMLLDGNVPQPTDQGPPPPGPEGDSGRQTRVVASATREIVAAEMALLRCREMAGNRIRNQKSKCPDCLRAANGRPSMMVASAIGAENLNQLKLEPRALVADGTEALALMLDSWGYTRSQAGTICEMVEVYAARTLFDEHVSLPRSVESQIAQIKEIGSAV